MEEKLYMQRFGKNELKVSEETPIEGIVSQAILSMPNHSRLEPNTLFLKLEDKEPFYAIQNLSLRIDKGEKVRLFPSWDQEFLAEDINSLFPTLKESDEQEKYKNFEFRIGAIQILDENNNEKFRYVGSDSTSQYFLLTEE